MYRENSVLDWGFVLHQTLLGPDKHIQDYYHINNTWILLLQHNPFWFLERYIFLFNKHHPNQQEVYCASWYWSDLTTNRTPSVPCVKSIWVLPYHLLPQVFCVLIHPHHSKLLGQCNPNSFSYLIGQYPPNFPVSCCQHLLSSTYRYLNCIFHS